MRIAALIRRHNPPNVTPIGPLYQVGSFIPVLSGGITCGCRPIFARRKSLSIHMLWRIPERQHAALSNRVRRPNPPSSDPWTDGLLKICTVCFSSVVPAGHGVCENFGSCSHALPLRSWYSCSYETRVTCNFFGCKCPLLALANGIVRYPARQGVEAR